MYYTMRTILLTLIIAFATLGTIPVAAQSSQKKVEKKSEKKVEKKTEKKAEKKPEKKPEKKVEAAPEPTPEELEQMAREEHRLKLIEEMLPSTRALTFIDSLVVDKDNFLGQLRMTSDIGEFTSPENLFPTAGLEGETGQVAFINSLKSTAYFSIADSLGNLRLNATYRNGGQWTTPQMIEEFEGFDYQDYPSLHSDGSTLYFAASGDESIGGLDLFATRYNEETRQFVRPQNMGFPYNSPANDYLLAIDDEIGIGVLVTDRSQPDDKVCIYWFIAEEVRKTYDLDSLVPEDADEESEEDEEEVDTPDPEEILRNFAAIKSIAATQVGHEEEIEACRARWEAALVAQANSNANRHRFIINDTTVYTSLEDFHVEKARAIAASWVNSKAELDEMEERLEQLRSQYGKLKSADLAATLQRLEVDIVRQRAYVKQLMKDYRAAELGK